MGEEDLDIKHRTSHKTSWIRNHGVVLNYVSRSAMSETAHVFNARHEQARL